MYGPPVVTFKESIRRDQSSNMIILANNVLNEEKNEKRKRTKSHVSFGLHSQVLWTFVKQVVSESDSKEHKKSKERVHHFFTNQSLVEGFYYLVNK